MPFETHELEAIKRAAATAMAEHSFDYGIRREDAMGLGVHVLDAIDKAASDPIDPRPFRPGIKVRVKGTGILGVVVRTVETSGELHTVIVRLALDEGDVEPETPFGPRELEVLA